MKAFLLTLTVLAGLASAKPIYADDFLTAEEIDKSALSDSEKGMASAAILSNPLIQCVSANETAGAESERLRIYHFTIGNVFQASVAVWKSYSKIRVFGSFSAPAELTAAFQSGRSSGFGTEAGNLTDQALVVQYGHNVPLLGKATTLKFSNPAGEASQICSLSK